MGLGISLSGLLANEVARTIGERSLALNNSFGETLTDDNGGFLDKIWNFGKSVVGFLWKAAITLVKGITFSAKAIFGWLVRVKEAIWTFNWQATDSELQLQIDAANVQIWSAWGGVIGRGIGWLAAITIGAGIAILVPVVGGTALAAAVVANTLPEAVEDLMGEITGAIGVTLAAVSTKAVLSGYIKLRRAIRGFVRGLDLSGLGETGAKIQNAINSWGQRPGVTWTFEEATSDAIEGIDSLGLQAFTENLLEESWDSFVEGGYIVADTIDKAYEMNLALKGKREKVVLYPDAENQNESIILYGNADEVPAQALQALSTHQLIANRDVGYFDIPDTDTPLKEPSLRELKIIFYTVQQPPWSRGKRHTIKIANPKESITFNDIKRATNNLDTGIWYASARLTGHRGKMVVHGSSADKARSNLESVAELCDGVLGNITVGQKIPSTKASSIQTAPIYPSYAQLSLKKPRSTGNLYADGERYELYGDRLTLWYDNSPIGSGSIYTWLRSRAAQDDDD